MLSTNDINKAYLQFQSDLHIDIKLPELLVIPNNNHKGVAQVGNKISNLIEFFVSDQFFSKKINNKYLTTVLYHEFTHIFDRMSLLQEITNNRKHRNLLFPYTEFHAAQIEMKKRLELFYNPQKQVSSSTMVYDKQGIITLKDFLEIELEEFNIRYSKLNENPTIDNIQNIMYIIIYNIGYFSVCLNYNINNTLFIPHNSIEYIENEINEITDIFINTMEPSDDLCMNVSNIIHRAVNKMIQHYNIKSSPTNSEPFTQCV